MARQASGSAKEVPGQQELMAFVSGMELRLEAVNTAYRLQQWELLTATAAPDLNSLDQERAKLLLDPDVWITVMRWVGALGPANPAHRRMVVLGRQLILASVDSQADVYELQNELSAEILQYRPLVGKDPRPWGEFVSILHTHPNRHTRQQAWQALPPLAVQLRARFLELVRRRNAWARKQGYDNYIDLALAPQGLSRDSVLERYVDLEEATALPYRSFVNRMQHQLRLDCLAQWDMFYLTHARLASSEGQAVFTGGVDDVVALIGELGLSWESLNVQPFVADGLPVTSLCWPVRVPDDIRMATSPQQGWEAYMETARAYGQALLAGLTLQPSFLLRQDAPAFREGAGSFLARLAAEPVWLRKRRLLPEAKLQRMAQISLELLVLRLRSLMALNVFEYSIYEDPDADLDAAWGKVCEAFLFLPNKPWSGWAALPELILRPIHLQDEIIGEIVASQAVSYLYQRFGYILGNPELTDFLKQTFYGPGAADDWVDKVRAATGKFLSNKALFGELVAEE
jgi:hypothetical protein